MYGILSPISSVEFHGYRLLNTLVRLIYEGGSIISESRQKSTNIFGKKLFILTPYI